MRSFNLEQAAAFLHLSPAALGYKARTGMIRAAKPGKRWVFLEDDLVAYVRSIYYRPGQAPPSGCDEEISLCHYTNAVTSGGLASPLPVDGAYAALLGLRTKS